MHVLLKALGPSGRLGFWASKRWRRRDVRGVWVVVWGVVILVVACSRVWFFLFEWHS